MGITVVFLYLEMHANKLITVVTFLGYKSHNSSIRCNDFLYYQVIRTYLIFSGGGCSREK